MNFKERDKNFFYVCPSCSAGCKNPSRCIKFDFMKCKEYMEHSDEQKAFIKSKIVNNNFATYQAFLDSECRQFILYYNNRTKDADDFFYIPENENNATILPNSKTEGILRNYILRKCLKESFSFSREININEYFCFFLHDMMQKLNFENIIVFTSCSMNEARCAQTYQCCKSWGTDNLNRVNPLFISNLSMEILTLCTDLRECLANQFSIFDKNYLLTEDFIIDIEEEENLYIKENQDGNEILEKGFNAYTFFKFCKITLLSHRQMHMWDKLTFCSQILMTGVNLLFTICT